MTSPKRTRLRRRRLIGWGGLSISIIVAGMFTATLRWYLCFWVGSLHIHSYPGGFGMTVTDSRRLDRPAFMFWRHYKIFQPDSFLGLSDSKSTGAASEWTLPLWPFFVFASMSPIVNWLWERHQLRRRRRRGHCETCGYNLTGSISGRCPECGAKTSKRNNIVRLNDEPGEQQ